MTNEEVITYFKKCNENLVSVSKDENVYDYEKQVIEADCMRRSFEANEKAIQALEQEPYEDCISREKAKQFLYERLDRLNDNELYDIFSTIIDDMYNELPSVTPTHKKGKWIGKGFGFACSECGYKYDIDDYTGIGVIHIKGKYCPNCGCNMEVEE